MKIWYALALAVVVGLGLVTIATRGIAAQGETTKQTFYVLIEVDAITGTDGYEAMMKNRPGNVAEAQMANARYLARTENITALDGAAPKAVVILAFANEANAKAYYENTKETTAMRIKATKSRSFIVEGL